MAVGPRLSDRARRRLALLAVLVVLLHALALWALSQVQVDRSLLRPMVAPMYTRVLQPQAAPAPAQAAAAAAAVERPRVRNVEPRASRPPSPVASAPAPAASEPVQAQAPPPEPAASEPPTDVVAAAPASPASEPLPAASAPAPDASAAAAAPPPAPVASAAASDLDRWPADTRLRYRLGGRFRSGELYGDARVLWQREGDRYQVRVEVNVTLLAHLVLTSQGVVRPQGLVPQVYEEDRRGRRRGLRIGEREIVLANGHVVSRPAGVQDTASQFVELSHRFASGRERLEVGRSVSFWMARPGQVDLWTYDIVQTEVLRTQLGDIEAFHLQPRPIANPRGNITAEMWFAPSLQYLPVRIRVNMGDEAQVDLLVEAIEQR